MEEKIELPIKEDDKGTNPGINPVTNEPAPGGDEPTETKKPEKTPAGNEERMTKEQLVKLPLVQRLMEEARQQEKDKLYNSLLKKDEKIEGLNGKIKDLEIQVTAKGDETMESEKELLAQLKALKDGQDDLVRQLEAEKKASAAAKLEAFREKKIAEAEGKLILGLVRGDSEEEIASSIEMAKVEYQKVVTPYEQRLEQAQKPNPSNAPKPSNPGTGGTPAIELTSEQIKAMSPVQYREYREKILASIRG